MTILNPARLRIFTSAAMSAALCLTTAGPVFAQISTDVTPDEIIEEAPVNVWRPIPADQLLVMKLAPDANGANRDIIIQLVPQPYSAGWVRNIRKLAHAHWWDGTSVNRVVDNWVTQWGDASEAKPLPATLETVPESDYAAMLKASDEPNAPANCTDSSPQAMCDNYAPVAQIIDGWPLASDGTTRWPVHCYASVGVGRENLPDTGSGAELYAAIGHAPRQLDRNTAVVGRVIEGIEYLSALPRGTGEMGFYAEGQNKVPIVSIRLASDLPATEQPHFEYMASDSDNFARYYASRANRKDSFYRASAGGVDVCNVKVPIRHAPPSGAGKK
ncbi:peptidylprolyl isomerase [Altererythrobacter indicus]|uniref:Peptidylprolyl isomerase n=1 Tax=Altericroceibacterium indicum TaxID=374177 RepID=A0A845ABE2_9SPHN|nr:peptidylprolyl isomerase [Altericroceibacterium indicum]MXP26689.1 peptidylprolyl isomerase [Altericroceibacterium indicum]